MLDYAACHGNYEAIPSLRNVEVVFLPANTTSLLQPLDAGIIAAVKKRYRRCQVLNALNQIRRNIDSVYNIDQLSAMTWVRNIFWQELDSSIIYNCWKKNRFSQAIN